MTRARLVDRYESLFEAKAENLVPLAGFLYSTYQMTTTERAIAILAYFRKKQEEVRNEGIS